MLPALFPHSSTGVPVAHIHSHNVKGVPNELGAIVTRRQSSAEYYGLLFRVDIEPADYGDVS
jgi:hypothetical protein